MVNIHDFLLNELGLKTSDLEVIWFHFHFIMIIMTFVLKSDPGNTTRKPGKQVKCEQVSPWLIAGTL